VRADPKIVTLDELAHDAHHPPRVGLAEIPPVLVGLKQLLVLRDGAVERADRIIDDPRRTRLAPPGLFRRRRSAGGAMARCGPLPQPFLRCDGRFGEDFRTSFLSAGGARRLRSLGACALFGLGHPWSLWG
jgi:hypothetical protein